MFGRKPRMLTRLLLVEDEPLVAFDTEHLLSDKGYEIVATVDRVSDAVALIEADKPIDLVLVDVTLADGNGLDVARAAGAKAIPVLFVSGDCPPEAELLAVGWLGKPYPQRSLLAAIEAVEKALGQRAPRRVPAGLKLFERAGA